MKGIIREALTGIGVIVFVTVLVLLMLAVSSGKMTQDEIKICILAPIVIVLTIYFGVHITKKERVKRGLQQKRICTRKKGITRLQP